MFASIPYISYIYDKVSHYFSHPIYDIPFNNFITVSADDKDFNVFKDNDIAINKVVFALNNLPDKIHQIISNNDSRICSKYFYITLALNMGEINDIVHNLDDIEQYNNFEYIFIRVNINTQNVINHVNCIIIDNRKSNIIFFEPKITFIYNVKQLLAFISTHIKTDKYKYIFPKDMGYMCHQLQYYDAFCQTYVLFAFLLIVNNAKIDACEYSNMFDTVITLENMGKFLHHINLQLEKNNCNICEQNIIWSYPTKRVKNIMNILHLFTVRYAKMMYTKYIDTNDIKFDSIIVTDDDSDEEYILV